MVRNALLAFLLVTTGEIGSIEAGKFADIIAVSGDPTKDISSMERNFSTAAAVCT